MTETMTETSPLTAEHLGSICPNCGAPKVHRSHRKGLSERLLALLGARVCRCHACNLRFARLFSSTVYVDDARRLLRRAALVLSIAAGTALVLIVMLWLMNQQAAIGPSDARLQGVTKGAVLLISAKKGHDETRLQ
jgi:hypothetical protein